MFAIVATIVCSNSAYSSMLILWELSITNSTSVLIVSAVSQTWNPVLPSPLPVSGLSHPSGMPSPSMSALSSNPGQMSHRFGTPSPSSSFLSFPPGQMSTLSQTQSLSESWSSQPHIPASLRVGSSGHSSVRSQTPSPSVSTSSTKAQLHGPQTLSGFANVPSVLKNRPS